MTLFTTLLVLIVERLFAGRALAARSSAGGAARRDYAFFMRNDGDDGDAMVVTFLPLRALKAAKYLTCRRWWCAFSRRCVSARAAKCESTLSRLAESGVP